MEHRKGRGTGIELPTLNEMLLRKWHLIKTEEVKECVNAYLKVMTLTWSQVWSCGVKFAAHVNKGPRGKSH